MVDCILRFDIHFFHSVLDLLNLGAARSWYVLVKIPLLLTGYSRIIVAKIKAGLFTKSIVYFASRKVFNGALEFKLLSYIKDFKKRAFSWTPSCERLKMVRHPSIASWSIKSLLGQ